MTRRKCRLDSTERVRFRMMRTRWRGLTAVGDLLLTPRLTGVDVPVGRMVSVAKSTPSESGQAMKGSTRHGILRAIAMFVRLVWKPGMAA